MQVCVCVWGGGNCKTDAVSAVGRRESQEMVRTCLLFALVGDTSLLESEYVNLLGRQVSRKSLMLLALGTNGLKI